MKYSFLVLLAFGTLFSCADPYEKLKPFSKLNGTWEYQSEEGKFVESWGEQKDSVVQGISHSLYGKDTLFSEKLRIVLRNNEIYYIPEVSNQNKGKEIAFKLKSLKENEWIFSNPRHDFPQEIKYEFRGKDSVIATISGKENGQLQTIPFPMRKVN